MTAERRVVDLEKALARAMDTIETMKERLAALEVARPVHLSRATVTEAVVTHLKQTDIVIQIQNRLSRNMESGTAPLVERAVNKIQAAVNDAISTLDFDHDAWRAILAAMEGRATHRIETIAKMNIKSHFDAGIANVISQTRADPMFREALVKVSTEVLDRFFVDRVLSRIPGATPAPAPSETDSTEEGDDEPSDPFDDERN